MDESPARDAPAAPATTADDPTAIRARLVSLDLVITLLLDAAAGTQADKAHALRVWLDRLTRSLAVYALPDLPPAEAAQLRQVARRHLAAIFRAVSRRDAANADVRAGDAPEPLVPRRLN